MRLPTPRCHCTKFFASSADIGTAAAAAAEVDVDAERGGAVDPSVGKWVSLAGDFDRNSSRHITLSTCCFGNRLFFLPPSSV